MHNAYSIKQLRNLPTKIGCLESYDDVLFVGTKEGHLFMYKVGSNHSLELMRLKKKFSKKSVLGLKAVKELSILLAFADSTLTVHDIDSSVTNLPVITNLSGAGSVNTFDADVSSPSTLSGEVVTTLRVVISVRKRLLFFYWKNRNFQKLREDIELPEVPKSVAWKEGVVILTFKPGEPLSIIKIGDSDEKVYQTSILSSTSYEPLVRALPHMNRFALVNEENTHFMDFKGNILPFSLTWPRIPLDMINDSPFFLAATSKRVDVMTDSAQLIVQTFELEKPRFLSKSKKGTVYVSSESHIWILEMEPISTQIPQLLTNKQFELALSLSNNMEESLEEKTKRSQHIQTLYGLELFSIKKFAKCFDIFLKVETDPSHVLCLFPNILPSSLRSQIKLPSNIVDLESSEGVLSLIDYLLNVRNKINGTSPKKQLNLNALFEGEIVMNSKKSLLTIIDTSLPRCYLLTNEALVNPFLRLKDNNCDLQETEETLTTSGKYKSLVIFYNSRGLHRKALSLLNSRKDLESVSDEEMVQYLRNLGPSHLDLIFEYAKDVTIRNNDIGITIFTEDINEVESLPRYKVMGYLMKTAPACVVIYLEHIIFIWKETDPIFHNELVIQYKNVLQTLKEDDNEFLEVKNKLSNFLTSTNFYEPENILLHFPQNILHEERAVLYGRNDQHEETLIIYLYILEDLPKAMSYCSELNSKSVYSYLVYLLLNPPKNRASLKNLLSSSSLNKKYGLQDVILILDNFGKNIDINTIIQNLPDEVSLSCIKNNLQHGISKDISLKHYSQIYKSLTHSEFLRIQKKRIICESLKIEISDLNMCTICRKRFSAGSAFVRMPDASNIVHYSCQEKAKMSPSKLVLT